MADTNTDTNVNAEPAQAQTPTVEELMADLAKERAEKTRLKASFDTASSELATAKKQLRLKMTEEEAKAAQQKEDDEAKDLKIQELETKYRVMTYSKRFMGIGMDEKSAESISELVGELPDEDKFFSALEKFVNDKVKTAGEEKLQSIIRNSPGIQAGQGNGENTFSRDKAKEIANRSKGADSDILNYYIQGGN